MNNKEKDWVGNSKSVYTTLGASNHTDKEREVNDYYATDPIAIDALINYGKAEISNNVWECACGEGHLAKRLSDYGYNVTATDLIDRGFGIGDVNFLETNTIFNGDIVTNPPYKYAVKFIEHALDIIPTGNKVFMFLKLQFLEGKSRKELFKKYPPKCIYVSSSRILCAKNGDFEGMKKSGGSAVAYAWYEWEKGYTGDTIIKWVN
ncbi:MAG: NAD(P)-dependent oxidoreductase [Clostridiales bacterium]|uniref:NAD(P)-dependent oxidoreductase n=1 Tax=Terrisporobacter sp. TaxID=1965305 RepID=UPI002A4FB33F|nr:NAD(P)-dependent oxidoreductase [Terrisporobacter sp.]MDD7756032.1 NAD(P)-dependent oxidoreductase [Clostridiales bacterium]MDY4134224.1 NAD(P)-dependent oxidoreductase [Terrisporobacter sp.]